MGCAASRDEAAVLLVTDTKPDDQQASAEDECSPEEEKSLQAIHDDIQTLGPKAPALGPPREGEGVNLLDLPECLSDLHDGMPPTIKGAPMRLLRIKAVLTWKALKVFEEMDPATECLEVPYEDTDDETWKRVVTVSWRWAEQKPEAYEKEFSPMSDAQFRELTALLRIAEERGLEFVWIDWSCVPQYGEDSMVEVHRSKVFYARARAMRVLPNFRPLPEGPVRLILTKAGRVLKRPESGSLRATVAADVIDGILAKNMVAGREYFGRVWTLAERMARHGRGEGLCQWLSLESWLGMVVDAMLKSTEDKAASQIYRKMLGQSASALLDAVLEPLAAAMRTGSVQAKAAEGLGPKVAELCKAAVSVWLSQCLLAEAPTPEWLDAYLGEEARSGVYQAWSEADRVWAIYSYFSWKSNLDQRSAEGLRTALGDLVEIAAGDRRVYLAGMFAQLGIVEQQTVVTPVDGLSSARRRQEEEAVAAAAAAERRRQEEEAAVAATERRRHEEVAAAAAAAERRKQEEAAADAAVERRKQEEAAAAAATATRRQQEEAAAAAGAERRRQEEAAAAAAAERKKQEEAAAAAAKAAAAGPPVKYTPGMRVTIRSVTVDEAKTTMNGHGGWADSMAGMLGKAGTVESVDKDGDVKVKMDSGGDSKLWHPVLLTPAATTPAPTASSYSVRTKVLINPVAVDEAKTAMNGHGGWADSMAGMLGLAGTVESVDKDGDVNVKMCDGGATKLWNPALLTKLGVGTKVVIRPMTVDAASSLQSGHGGWASEMAKMLGKPGAVEDINADGDMKVKMDDGSGSYRWNPALLCAPGSAAAAAAAYTQGMRVLIKHVTLDEAKTAMHGHGGWSDSMAGMLGLAGTVESVDKDGDVNVKMCDGSDTKLWNPALLTKLGVGTKVSIRAVTVDEAKRLQSGHGGWANDMEKMLGKSGTVDSVDKDFDMKVKMDDGSGCMLWNPALFCVPGTPAPAAAAAAPAPAAAAVVVAPPSGSMAVGSKVRIKTMTAETAQEGQKDHGGWNTNMAKCIGKTGVVTYKWADGDVKVKMDDGTGEYCWNKDSVALDTGTATAGASCRPGAHTGSWRPSSTKYWCSTVSMAEGPLCIHGSEIIKAPHWSCCGDKTPP